MSGLRRTLHAFWGLKKICRQGGDGKEVSGKTGGGEGGGRQFISEAICSWSSWFTGRKTPSKPGPSDYIQASSKHFYPNWAIIGCWVYKAQLMENKCVGHSSLNVMMFDEVFARNTWTVLGLHRTMSCTTGILPQGRHGLYCSCCNLPCCPWERSL